MSKTDKARADVQATLAHDETIQAIESAQVKVADRAKRAAKDVALSAAASVAVGAVTGFGMMRMTIPPQVWIALTNKRVLMFSDTRNGGGRGLVGELVFDAPRAAVSVTEKVGLFSEVTISDTITGEAIARLNFGMRKKDAAAIMQAAA